ncbi:DUF2992 family protein [Nonomuraea sp. NPDC001636]|uniref:DUF2992 family protein n=1 Tax=Nonomuraea sp. NPDC001636 TaxID=3154391 RepID=UPI00331E30F7
MSVYLDGPFWVGVLEVAEGGRLRATRFTLGSEPTDPELHAFLMRHGVSLLEQAHAAQGRRERRRELAEHKREVARRKRLERRRDR